LKKVRMASVALDVGGYASGVIIDPDGTTLTAAHVLKMHKKGAKINIILEDGRKYEAEPLGYNEETDLAVVKVQNPKKDQLQFVSLAAHAPDTGDAVFTFSHPSGLLKGRPAQVRLGRITSISNLKKKAAILQCDCNIQPGDSGGPMFNMKGELVAISSSAAGIIGFNRFASTEQYKLDKKKLLAGEKWGDPDKGPVSSTNAKMSFTGDLIKKVEAEMMKRFKAKHIPTVDFIMSMTNNNGEVKVDANKMVNFMAKDALAIANNLETSMGLQDPALTKHLPKIPKAPGKLRIVAEGKATGYGIAVDEKHIALKWSTVKELKDKVGLRSDNGVLPLSFVACSEEWDLALYKLDKKVKLPAIQWDNIANPAKAGQGLVAPDHKNRALWGVATDERRVVSKARSLGPLRDKGVISKHRAPYPQAIRHSLPLWAKDSGTAVFDFEGQFIGMHIARFSRTMGLIIPAQDLKEACNAMLKKGATESK